MVAERRKNLLRLVAPALALATAAAMFLHGRSAAAPCAMRKFSASQLGLSIDIPATWQKYQPGTCGSGFWPPPSEDEVLRRPIYLIGLRDPQQRARVTVTFYRKADQDLATVMKWYRGGGPSNWLERLAGRRRTESDFTVGRLTGKRIQTDGAWLTEKEPFGATFVSYVLVHDGRRVDITASCPGRDFAAFAPAFDAMAGSLVLSAPLIDPPLLGAWKCFSRPEFSFEYPGDWVRLRPYDDDAPPSEDCFHGVRGPCFPGAQDGYIQSEIQVVRDKTVGRLEEFEADVRGALAGTTRTTLDVRTFQTAAGKTGLQLVTCDQGLYVDRITTSFVFQARDDQLIYLTCSCPATRWGEYQPLFEHAGYSFCVQENPG